MRSALLIVALSLSLAGAASSQSSTAQPQPTGTAAASDSPYLSEQPASAPGTKPAPSQKGIEKQAQHQFLTGLKLAASDHVREAMVEFDGARRLQPNNREYATAYEMERQRLVEEALSRGNAQLEEGRAPEALAEYRAAAQIDPSNAFVQQRLRDAVQQTVSAVAPSLITAPAPPLRFSLIRDEGDIQLQATPGPRNYHFRGESRTLYEQVGRDFGVGFEFEDSFQSKALRFDIDGADFATMVRLLNQTTHTFLVPLSTKRALVVGDTQDKRRDYEGLVVRTFYLTETATAQEVNEVTNLLRSTFDIRFLSPSVAGSAITVKAPRAVMDAVTAVVESLSQGKPQVMLDLRAYELSHTTTRDIGVTLPLQFQIINVLTEARALLSNPSTQDAINKLIASGGINQADPAAIAALLLALQGQQGSILTQSIATFGGGITREGVVLPKIGAKASFNDSNVRSSNHVVLRATHGDTATFRSGTRFPIVAASYAPIANSPALARVIGNNTFQTPFPAVTYEDLGVTLKATPMIHGDSGVTLKLELQIKALGGTSFNGVPVITNREYTGTITLKDGETAVMAGSISRSEGNSVQGLPGLGRLPVVGRLVSTRGKETVDNELILVMTPHIASLPTRRDMSTTLGN